MEQSKSRLDRLCLYPPRQKDQPSFSISPANINMGEMHSTLWGKLPRDQLLKGNKEKKLRLANFLVRGNSLSTVARSHTGTELQETGPLGEHKDSLTQ
jgi:hypothetical protein